MLQTISIVLQMLVTIKEGLIWSIVATIFGDMNLKTTF